MLIDQAGFDYVLKMDNMKINHLMVTTLCERWRIETDTFHMPFGETTVTLEDVSLQLGVPIDGELVTGSSFGNLIELCKKLLENISTKNMFTSNQIKLWLNTGFREIPADANLRRIRQCMHTLTSSY